MPSHGPTPCHITVAGSSILLAPSVTSCSGCSPKGDSFFQSLSFPNASACLEQLVGMGCKDTLWDCFIFPISSRQHGPWEQRLHHCICTISPQKSSPFWHTSRGSNTWLIILPKWIRWWYRDLQKEMNHHFPWFSFISPGVLHMEEV